MDNSDVNTTHTLEPENETASTPVVIIVVFTTALSILFNTPVIAMVFCDKCINGRNIKNVHILSLSISDLFTGLSALPVFISFGITGIDFTYMDCLARLMVLLTVLTASICHLIFICIDRCWTLNCRAPVTTLQVRVKVWAIVLMAWIIAFLVISVPMIVLKTECDIPYCALHLLFPSNPAILKVWSLLFVGAMLIVIGICLSMVCQLYKQNLNLRKIQPTTVTTTKTSRKTLPSLPSQNIAFIDVKPSTSSSAGFGVSHESGSSSGSSYQLLPRKMAIKTSTKKEFALQTKAINSQEKVKQDSLQLPVWLYTQKAGTATLTQKCKKPNVRQNKSKKGAVQTCNKAVATSPIKDLTDNVITASAKQTSKCFFEKIPKHQRRAVNTILIIAALFCITLSPMCIVTSIEAWGGKFFSRQLRHGVVYFACLNSSLNPIIYAFRIPEVRSGIKALKSRIFCRCVCMPDANV